MQTNMIAATGITGPESAEEMRARLAAIVESSDDAIISKTLEGIITSWNPAAERIFGYSAAETIGRPMLMLFPADRLGEEPEILSRLQRGERTDHFETVRIRKDGRRIDVSVTLSPLRDRGGKIIGASKIARDITDRKTTEAAAAQLAAIVRTSDDAIIGKDLNNLITSWNRGAERLFGYPAGEMLGTSIMRLIPPEQQPQENDILERVKHGLSMEQFETVRKTEDGRLIAVSITASPIQDARGKVVGVSKVARDITERKQVEETLAEAVERLRSVTENMSEGLIIFDPQGNCLYQNSASLRIHGYESAEGGRFKREELPAVYRAWDKTGRPLNFEDWPIARVCRQERFQDQVLHAQRVNTGHEWFGSYNGCPILGAGGKLRLGFITIRDITIQVQAEEKSRQLHAVVAQEKDRLSALVNSITDEIWFADTEGIFTLVNPSGSREFGLADAIDVRKLAQDLEVYRPDGSLRPIEDAPPLRALRGEVVQNQEEIIRTPATNELRYRQVSASPVKDAAGHIVGSVSVVRDITERKRAEAAVRESEEKFRTMANSMPQLAWIARADGYIFWYNQRWYEYTGTTPEQMEGWGWQSVHDPAMLPKVMENWTGAIAAGQPFEMEFPLRGADGQFRDFLSRGQPLKNDAGKVTQWFGTNTDITVQKEAEHQLRGQLSRLALFDQITRATNGRLDFQSILQAVIRNLEDNLPVDFGCVCLHDASAKTFKVVQVGVKSEALAAELAMPENMVISMDGNGLSHCADGQLVYEPDVRQMKFPFPQRLAQGGLRSLIIAPLPVEGKVIGFLIVARNAVDSFASGEREFLKQLSEHVALAAHHAKLHGALQTAYDDLRRTQQAALQQEHLRALGQMASGIAHDINNAMTPVLLYSELLLDDEPNLSTRARGYLETIKRSTQDAAETISRMREFYRQREPQLTLTPIYLNVLAQQVLDFTRVRWSDEPQKRGVVILPQVQLEDHLPTIMGVESEIRDALVNLIFNAVDAMPAGGTLTLRTVTEPNAPGTNGTPAARRVCLELTDTGKGMDEDTRHRCLEPFFTTKGPLGTGLGLAMVYGMMKRHSAEIEITSSPGQGTIVRLLFPVSDVITDVIPPPLDTKIQPAHLRILFVDDDPLLIQSIRDTLSRDGHTVVTAAGGQEGIHTFMHAQERQEPFSVVITDLGMPYVDGRKVASAVKAASPSMPVIMLTGWGQRLEAENDVPADVVQLLSKPPKLCDLRKALAACCPPMDARKTKV